MSLGSDLIYEQKGRNFLLASLFSLTFLFTAFKAFTAMEYAWVILSASVFLISALPFLSSRETVAAPWELLVLVSLPFLHKAFGLQIFSGVAISYISVAVTSLLLVVEIDEFTSLETNSFFAVFLTAVLTVAMAGFWALIRWLSDIYLGTALIVSEEHLMWEFTAATSMGVIGGMVFHFYFKNRIKDLGAETV